MDIFFLSLWTILCCVIGLANTGAFDRNSPGGNQAPEKSDGKGSRVERRSRVLSFFAMSAGNVLWIGLTYDDLAKTSFIFMIIWAVIHGLCTILVPIAVGRIRLGFLQVLGLAMTVAGCALLFVFR